MPLNRRDPANLYDMLEASEKVLHFLKEKTFEDFLRDDMLRAAVERNLEIIGEAARRISEEVKQEHPEIPWRKIIALRNVLIHEYDDIDYKEIWQVATFPLPRLIDQIRPLIPPLPPETSPPSFKNSRTPRTKEMDFQRFIGIDWSGARKPGRRIQVAECYPGNAAPQIVPTGSGRNWRREEVRDWLVQLHNTGEKVLAGFDFAFAYPYCDKDAYFPGHDQSPTNAESLWKLVDSICVNQNARDFYGGPFYNSPDAMFAQYLLYQNYRGEHYEPRLRITDQSCPGNPSTVFKCVGPGSVGCGSVAGMRLLHDIKSKPSKSFLIWPFQPLDSSRSVIIEIYPRLFFRLAKYGSIDRGNRTHVNSVLTHFDSDHLSETKTNYSEDEVDAIISAAAIRHLSNNLNTWKPRELTECARLFEGWIFGVGSMNR